MNKIDNIQNGKFSLGTWISTGSPVVAELVSQYAFDWILIDFEHGAVSDAILPEMLRGISHQPTNIIVRVAELSPSLISRALDWGADGIMLPHVRSPEEAKRCVEAMRYPPDGKRGYSSSVRAYGYGTTAPTHLASIKPLLFIQIEDLTGVNNLEEIAAVDGVDVLFVGPADLQLALNSVPVAKQIGFEEAIRLVAASANKYNKQAGILLRDHDQVKVMRTQGYNCIAVDSDLALLRQGYEKLIKEFKR